MKPRYAGLSSRPDAAARTLTWFAALAPEIDAAAAEEYHYENDEEKCGKAHWTILPECVCFHGELRRCDIGCLSIFEQAPAAPTC